MACSDAPAQIVLYTLSGRVHCARAKRLLSRRDLPFREVDGTAIPDFRLRLGDLIGGVTVPQIVIDEIPIGGADRLARLDRLGVLEAIASDEPFPIARELRRISPSSVVRWAAARVRGRHGVSPVRRVQVRLDRAGRTVEPVSITRSKRRLMATASVELLPAIDSR
jgi:glutaredoxin 3